MKIAIVGGSPASEFLAPFNDPEWQIWVLGNRIQHYKRADRIFEIHDDLSEHGDSLKYAQLLAARNIPMIVGEKFPISAPHIRTFDFEAAKALYGSNYLTSSTAYQVAQAIMEGATHISIYGTDMAVDSHEYFWQRPCLESWIGFAKARGIEVYIPPVSPLGRSEYIEGRGCGGRPDFSKPPFTQAEFSAMADVHAKRISALHSKIAELQADAQTHDGARQAYERLAMVARAVEAGNDIKNLTDSFRAK